MGLIDLKEIFEELKIQKDIPESILKEMLVEKAAKKNYILSSVKGDYEKAIFREFKKFLDEKVEEERSEFLEVIILGADCFSCNQLEKDILGVLSETGIKASLNHITDPRIAQYGILPPPALIINGKVKSKGIISPKSMIKKWLEETCKLNNSSGDQLKPSDVQKLLPGTNRKECGLLSCLAFAFKLVDRKIEIVKCPPLFSDQFKEKRNVLLETFKNAGLKVPPEFLESGRS